MKMTFFKLAYNELNYPILVTSFNCEIIWANKKFLQIFKTTQKNLVNLGQYFFDDEGKCKSFYNTFKSNYTISCSEIIYENEKFQILSFFNITRRKNLEKELEFGQNIFETLCEQLPEGIILHEDKVIYTNLIFRKKMKYQKSKILEKEFIEFISKDDKELFSTYFENLELNKNKEFIFKLVRSNNSEFWASIKTNKLYRNNGTFVYLSLIKDITIDKLKLEELNILANYDKLTDVLNRRKFDELLLSEYKRTKRYKLNTCGLFLDIDYFKKINDTYGHDIGDLVLIEFSKLIKNHIRNSDIFARWGGEEFIIILTETNITDAKTFAEKLRGIIEQNSFDKVSKVTSSIGLTQLKENERLNSFLKRLDTALYKAKENGRNRIEVL